MPSWGRCFLCPVLEELLGRSWEYWAQPQNDAVGWVEEQPGTEDLCSTSREVVVQGQGLRQVLPPGETEARLQMPLTYTQ